MKGWSWIADNLVHNCEFVASGETLAEIVEQMVKHLRSRYEIDLPDPEEILTGRTPADRLMDGRIGEDAALVVTRLREKLGIDVESERDLPEIPRAGIIAAKGPFGEGPITG
jgi:hypothetical protein